MGEPQPSTLSALRLVGGGWGILEPQPSALSSLRLVGVGGGAPVKHTKRTALGGGWVGPGAWSLEPGAWSLEPGAWSLDPQPSALSAHQARFWLKMTIAGTIPGFRENINIIYKFGGFISNNLGETKPL